MKPQELIELLNEPLATDNIKQRQGTGGNMYSYLTGHHVIAEANRLFGFGGWSTEIKSLTETVKEKYEKPPYKQGESAKKMVAVAYICQLRLTVKVNGEEKTCEDTGFGDGTARDTPTGLLSCIELSTKEAVTDALKRCFRQLGNQFGNTLYDTEGSGAMSMKDIAQGKTVRPEDLKNIDKLLDERGVDRLWLLVALKDKGYTFKTIEEMPVGWFQAATEVAYNHKLNEVQVAGYADRIETIRKLMVESVSTTMLEKLFKEGVKHCDRHNDGVGAELLIKLNEEVKLKLIGEKK